MGDSTPDERRPKRTLAPLFTWRSAIAESDLPPTTRHVLLTLSCYMNERGGSCYPGSALIANDSGLHQSTVKAHLSSAVDLGWLRVLRKGSALKGQPRLATEYVATVPVDNRPGVEDTRSADLDDRGFSAQRPGVQDAPISSVITPLNSRGASRSGVPDCVQCQGRGSYPSGAGFDRVCPCCDTRDTVEVEL